MFCNIGGHGTELVAPVERHEARKCHSRCHCCAMSTTFDTRLP
jgi:hypothetical protein